MGWATSHKLIPRLARLLFSDLCTEALRTYGDCVAIPGSCEPEPGAATDFPVFPSIKFRLYASALQPVSPLPSTTSSDLGPWAWYPSALVLEHHEDTHSKTQEGPS